MYVVYSNIDITKQRGKELIKALTVLLKKAVLEFEQMVNERTDKA